MQGPADSRDALAQDPVGLAGHAAPAVAADVGAALNLVAASPAWDLRRSCTYTLELLCVAAAYFLLAKLGLTLASINPSATPIWPPTGLALAVVILRGYRMSPAIFVAAMLANETTAGSIYTSLAIAAGNTLESVVGGYLILRWSGGRATFGTPAGVIGFALISLLAATPISAAIGVGSLSLAAYAAWPEFASIWITWWLGDLAGALVITPVIVLWATREARALSRRALLDSAAVFASAAVVGLFAFSPLFDQAANRGPLGFLAILPLLWAALRRGQRDTATTACILAGFAVWGTAMNGGPFAQSTLNDSFLLLLTFIISITVPSLALSADVAVRRRVENELRRAHEELEQRVRHRTAALQEARDELHQAQKMEALGQLTGGIAHDFNNILTAITNSLESMRASARSEPGQRRRLDRALQAARNGAALIQQMLVFARKQPLQPQPTDVNAIVSETLMMFGRSSAENIEIVAKLAPDLRWANVDATQLQAAILNVAVNARDAMPSGGTLTFHTTNLPRETSAAARPASGERICITVADTGMGMPPAILERAIEPFFTTKDVGKGTGLGLSMVYSAVRQMAGDVRIESEPGKGTSVHLILPSTDTASPSSAAAPGRGPADPSSAEPRRASILCVEDDPLVRLSVVDVLQTAGFATHAASDGRGALALIDAHPEIEILVTDVGLPGMNGHELAAEARRRRPDLKVLFVSGYDRTRSLSAFLEDSSTKFLPKPYRDSDLFDALRRLSGAGHRPSAPP